LVNSFICIHKNYISSSSIINVTYNYCVCIDDKKVGVSFWSDSDLEDARPCYSQPAMAPISFAAVSIPPNESEIHSFSQPTQVDDLLLSSQLQTSQSAPTTTNVIIQFKIHLYITILEYYMIQFNILIC